MITLYGKNGIGQTLNNNPLTPEIFSDAVWIDLLAPSDEEHLSIEKLLGIDLPSHDDMTAIQISSQLFVDGNVLNITTPIIAGTETRQFDIGALCMILTPNHLITLRYLDPKSIGIFAQRAKQDHTLLQSPQQALLGLLETMIDRSVDILELTGDQLDDISSNLFQQDLQQGDARLNRTSGLRKLLRETGSAGDLLSKFRNALAGTDRVTVFLSAVDSGRFQDNDLRRIKTLQRDVRTLEQHADSLQQRVTFLLDAVLGVASIEQNNIMRIFSIAAVALMPPTLIGSIYGMNFHFMPELSWPFGYPFALLLMALSAIIPSWYFRRKGWL